MTHEHVLEHDAPPAPLPKDRATRRAHGQRGPQRIGYAAAKKWTGRNTETGPQRAQRRAAAKGLTVGAPVRARVGIGVGYRSAPPDPAWIPYGERTYAGPDGATPLGRVDRLARYLLQREATTHQRQGSNWRPTARQHRRLDKKSRRGTSVRPYAVTPESERLAEFWAQRPDNSVMVAAETLAAPVAPQQFAGFRVVDRRGEHR